MFRAGAQLENDGEVQADRVEVTTDSQRDVRAELTQDIHAAELAALNANITAEQQAIDVLRASAEPLVDMESHASAPNGGLPDEEGATPLTFHNMRLNAALTDALASTECLVPTSTRDSDVEPDEAASEGVRPSEQGLGHEDSFILVIQTSAGPVAEEVEINGVDGPGIPAAIDSAGNFYLFEASDDDDSMEDPNNSFDDSDFDAPEESALDKSSEKESFTDDKRFEENQSIISTRSAHSSSHGLYEPEPLPRPALVAIRVVPSGRPYYVDDGPYYAVAENTAYVQASGTPGIGAHINGLREEVEEAQEVIGPSAKAAGNEDKKGMKARQDNKEKGERRRRHMHCIIL